MNIFEVFSKRCSIRAYHDRPVEPNKIVDILNSMNSAPTAGNLQAFAAVVVSEPEPRRLLAKAAWGQMFIAEAPIALVVLADMPRSAFRYGERGTILYAIQDATIVTTYAMLTATALGLATCWVGAFSERDVARIVGCSSYQRPIAILSIGYGRESPPRTPRRPVREWVREI